MSKCKENIDPANAETADPDWVELELTNIQPKCKKRPPKKSAKSRKPKKKAKAKAKQHGVVSKRFKPMRWDLIQQVLADNNADVDVSRLSDPSVPDDEYVSRIDLQGHQCEDAMGLYGLWLFQEELWRGWIFKVAVN